MLAILSEGGNLDHLGETAQMLGGNNELSVTSSAPSQVTKKEGNERNFQRKKEIPVIFEKEYHKMLSSTFVSTQSGMEERNQGRVHKANSKEELIDQHSLVSTDTQPVQNNMLEISSKECKIDEVGDSVVKSESASFGEITAEDKRNNGGNAEDNLEEVFIAKITNMKTDVDSRKPNQKEGLKAAWPGAGSLTPGLLFPDYNSMTTSLDEWSRANFSPMTKASSGSGGFGQAKPFHNFRCPHKKAHKRSSLGLRRAKANVIEYVDCPFLIDTKVNSDGSCVVTRAMTDHIGHPVSEDQFQIYRR